MTNGLPQQPRTGSAGNGTPQPGRTGPTTERSTVTSTAKRVLRWAFMLLVTVAVALYLILPATMGLISVLPVREPVGAPPAGAESVVLETADGVELSAWFVPPATDSVIIVLHGAGDSREGIRRHVALLKDLGHGVLAVDMRGHGTSVGRTNRLGWDGTKDVAAAVAFLADRAEVGRIGALGLSMGGEVLLGAAAEHPEIEAIVADGATRRSIADLTALPSERPLVRNFTARVMFAAARVFGGTPPPRPLVDSMTAAEATRFLFVAAGADPLEVAFNKLFAQRLGDRAELWVVPNATHTGALATCPDEYAARVARFFDRSLGSAP